MSLYRDKQIRGFCFFLAFFAFLLFGMSISFGISQINHARALYLTHDEAVASSLLEQGVSGIGEQTKIDMLFFLHQFQRSTLDALIAIDAFLLLVLAVGTFVFFWRRKHLYLQVDKVLSNYINGDYSCHLPQNNEGTVFQILSSVEQLATMLQAKSETEHKAREFLKDTISDISHQLKTPLAALAMYQEIIENDPDNVETVKEFSLKIGTSLKRMEQLIQSMLKITRLDAGNIVFEKNYCNVTELIAHSINELSTRAQNEDKQILLDGESEQQIICDMEWTSEAIGNIVKNALDHTASGGIIRITWKRTPVAFHISISDNGHGIASEDIHHIFKRFYRSRHSLDTQGIGLGLPLAKSIIEGQNGLITVQSERNEGTTFTISLLTES